MSGQGSVQRLLAFHPDDVHDFGEALKKKYERIQCVSYDYLKSQKPRDPNVPPRFEVPYFDSLDDLR